MSNHLVVTSDIPFGDPGRGVYAAQRGPGPSPGEGSTTATARSSRSSALNEGPGPSPGEGTA